MMFIDLEVVLVGFIEVVVCMVGYDICVVDYEFGWIVGVSVYVDYYEGYVCVIIDVEYEVLIGVIFVGLDVVEML